MTKDMFTQVEVKRNDGQGALGYGSLLVCGVVRVNFTIRKGREDKPFAALPAHKGKNNDKWTNDVAFPDDEVYKLFQKVVLDAYEKAK